MTTLTPVGAFLREELKERNLAQAEFARRCGLARTQVTELLGGRRRCTAFLAVRLAPVLGVSPELLLNLQQVVDLHEARAAMKEGA